jgi:hypothetical protein
MIQRRTLLFAGTFVLGGCASLTPFAIESDVQLVANGIQAFAPLLAPLGVPASVVAEVLALAADVAAQTTPMGSVISSLTPPSNVAAIVSDVQAIAGLVEPILPNTPAGNAARVILMAALALLPSIQAAAGLPVAAGSAPGMAPADARAVLRGV